MKADDLALVEDVNLETQKLLYMYLCNKGRKKNRGREKWKKASYLHA